MVFKCSERLKNLYKKSRKGDKIGNILTKKIII